MNDLRFEQTLNSTLPKLVTLSLFFFFSSPQNVMGDFDDEEEKAQIKLVQILKAFLGNFQILQFNFFKRVIFQKLKKKMQLNVKPYFLQAEIIVLFFSLFFESFF